MKPFDPTEPLVEGITLLEASAGTGKTYSITSLLLRLVAEQGLGLREILVVTFTEAATAELRERVRQRLRSGLAALERAARDPGWEPEDDVLRLLVAGGRAAAGQEGLAGRRTALRMALDGFDEAQIATIHGFCRRMLQQHAFESGVELDVELVADIGPQLEEVVQDFWTAELHDAPEPLLRYLQAQGFGLSQLFALARLAGETELPVTPPPPELGPPPDGARWRELYVALQQAWARNGDAALGLLREAIDRKELNGRVWRHDWAAARTARMVTWLAGPPRPGAGVAEDLYRFSCGELAAATKAGKPAPDHPLFALCAALYEEEQALQQGLAGRALVLAHRLVAYARRELARRKRQRHVQSFDDLLRLLRRGLGDPAHGERLRQAIRQQYKAALIDEFQDTDPVQWDIFRTLFGDRRGWLYLIGDPKQAIYAFRGADIFTYLAAKREAAAAFTLGTNWRSDGRFVDALHHLFGRDGLVSPFVFAGIDYVPVAAAHRGDRLLRPGGPAAPLRLRFVPRPPERQGKPINKGEAWGLLAELVATDIAELLNSGATIDPGEGRPPRPLAPRDIAVLVRKHAQAEQLQRALRAAGIPAVLHGADSVLRSAEAAELALVLAAVAEPRDLRALRAALATPLLGLSANELDLLERDEAGLEAWLGRFGRWHDLWLTQGFIRMLRAVLADTALPARLLAWTDGERRMTNLLHLAELLHAAATERRLRPAGLLAWLQQQRSATAPEEDADARQLRLESDAHAVELVTIHRSKGLQYPVVFCPYLWDGRLGSAGERFLRFHDPAADGALALDIDPEGPERAAHVEQAAREEQAENLRLLYVALTRAKHGCTVYWGAFRDAATSPLAYLLHQAGPGEDGDRLTATAARVAGLADAELLAELRQLAQGSGGTIEVSPVTLPVAPARWLPTPQPAPTLAAREFTRPFLDSWWRRGSFSQMAHSAGEEVMAGPSAEGLDWDALAGDELAASRAGQELAAGRTGQELAAGRTGAEPRGDDATMPDGSGGPEVVLADFPRGVQAGLCLHKVLELLDFTVAEPGPLRRLLREQLYRHGLEARWCDVLEQGLRQALATPLDPARLGGLRLLDVAKSERFDELGFDLPVAGGLAAAPGGGVVAPRGLAGVFARQAGPALPATYPAQLARLTFLPLRGFLTGSIDLVFRHGERWYLVDYKSNHLGDRLECYVPGLLREEMASRHYFLQYHLYTVALHRYLQWKLAGYSYERHFGGVFYLFLRGMPGADGPGLDCGVFRDRPPVALVQALDELLRRGAAGQAARGERAGAAGPARGERAEERAR